MGVRSKTLAFGSAAAAATTTIYTVPAGETALVKWGSFFNTHSAAVSVSLHVGFGAGAFKVWKSPALAADNGIEVPLWWALAPGDIVRIGTSFGGVINFALYGAELEGVAD